MRKLLFRFLAVLVLATWLAHAVAMGVVMGKWSTGLATFPFIALPALLILGPDLRRALGPRLSRVWRRWRRRVVFRSTLPDFDGPETDANGRQISPGRPSLDLLREELGRRGLKVGAIAPHAKFGWTMTAGRARILLQGDGYRHVVRVRGGGSDTVLQALLEILRGDERFQEAADTTIDAYWHAQITQRKVLLALKAFRGVGWKDGWTVERFDATAAPLGIVPKPDADETRIYDTQWGAAHALVEGGEVRRFELFAEVTDPGEEELDNERYEELLTRYRAKFDEALSRATKLFGQPFFAGGVTDAGFPEEEDAILVALWATESAHQMLLLQNVGREMPFSLSVVLSPRRPVS